MKENKLINFDSYYSTKNNLNCYYISYKIDSLKSIKKIHLKSIEIPICLNNVRSPYSTFYYTINNISYNFTLPDKTYISIYSLLIDLNNAIVLNIQPKLQVNEIGPIFSVSPSKLNVNIDEFVTVVIIILFNSDDDNVNIGAISFNCNFGWIFKTIALFRSINKL